MSALLQEKIEDLGVQVKALHNSKLSNMLALKHNATAALANSFDIIQELADSVNDLKREVRSLKKKAAKAKGVQ